MRARQAGLRCTLAAAPLDVMCGHWATAVASCSVVYGVMALKSRFIVVVQFLARPFSSGFVACSSSAGSPVKVMWRRTTMAVQGELRRLA